MILADQFSSFRGDLVVSIVPLLGAPLLDLRLGKLGRWLVLPALSAFEAGIEG